MPPFSFLNNSWLSYFNKEAFTWNLMPEPKFEEKQKILQISEISLILDTYDDIFSDFDPRQYSERAVSDDFLYEAKKASRDKPSGAIELKLLIPANQQKADTEKVIKKRLHDHFKKNLLMLENEMKETKKKGLITAVVGIFLLLVAAGVALSKLTEAPKTIITVLLEPAGWFTCWFGFEQLFYTSNTKKPDKDFYEKMSKCEISFTSY